MHNPGNTATDGTLTTGQLSRRGLLKFVLGMAGSAAAGSVLAACVTRDDGEAPAAEPDDDGNGEPAAEPDDDSEDLEEDDRGDSVAAETDEDFDVEQLVDDWLEEFEPIVDVPQLAVGSGETEIQGETYDVWAYENTWIGGVTDDLFIAFSIEEGYSQGSGEISAYACDSGDSSVYLTGELVDGEADLDDCIDKIELALVDGEITGEITLEGEEPLSFVATPADGEAGLYRAETIEMGEIEFTPRWVVLEDGRQRGGFKCRNPWTGDCMTCPRPR